MTTKYIPQAADVFFVVKLKCGDELLTTLVNEDDDGISIEDPIQIKFIPSYDEDGEMIHTMMTNKWCVLSDTDSFFLSYDDIITYVPMAPGAYALYVNAVNKYAEMNTIADTMDLMSEHAFVVDATDTIQ